VRSYEMRFSHEIAVLGILFRSSLSDSKPSMPDCWYIQCTAAPFRETQYVKCEIFQAESVRDAAFGCNWVGTPIPFQRCLLFIIATANKEFQLSAGNFVPVSNVTTLNVCTEKYNQERELVSNLNSYNFTCATLHNLNDTV
jgi:hypothetical protein